MVLTHESVKSKISSLENKDFSILFLDSDWNLMKKDFPQDNLPCVTTVNDVVNVMYTSGSTGQPKGILVEHRNLLNVLSWHQDYFQLTSEDRHAQVISLGFDPVGLEVWSMLIVGGSLHICDDETRMSTQEFIRFVLDKDITLCTLATPVAELMMQVPLLFMYFIVIKYVVPNLLHTG